MAARRVKVGEKVRLRYGNHKEKFGVVTAHERRTNERRDWRGRTRIVTLITYVVEVENVGPRRFPGSYLDLIG